MGEQAKGTFETKTTPNAPYDTDEGATIGRMTVEKRFVGGLEASGHVEMLAARSAVPSSAGYVAIERVKGTLDGRVGSFVLQHSGTMNRGAPSLVVSIVPATVPGALLCIAGPMTIPIT